MSAEDLSEALAKLDPADPRYATDVVEPRAGRPRGRGASDVHLQPSELGLDVTWRIDGVLQQVTSLPAKLAPNLIARLKVLADLLTYRTDVPQEGRIKAAPGGVEMRVSTFPTLFGEKAVVRMFAGPGRFLRLDDLGLPAAVKDESVAGAWRNLGRDRARGTGGKRQDDHDLRLPARAVGSIGGRAIAGEPRRSDRVGRTGRRAGAGQRRRRAHARVGPEVAVAPGPGGDRHRRDSRQGHRGDGPCRPR